MPCPARAADPQYPVTMRSQPQVGKLSSVGGPDMLNSVSRRCFCVRLQIYLPDAVNMVREGATCIGQTGSLEIVHSSRCSAAALASFPDKLACSTRCSEAST